MSVNKVDSCKVFELVHAIKVKLVYFKEDAKQKVKIRRKKSL